LSVIAKEEIEGGIESLVGARMWLMEVVDATLCWGTQEAGRGLIQARFGIRSSGNKVVVTEGRHHGSMLLGKWIQRFEENIGLRRIVLSGLGHHATGSLVGPECSHAFRQAFVQSDNTTKR